MPEPITARQLGLLAYVGKNPGVTREHLLQVAKATETDINYLETLDLIREREVGTYRIAHLGEKVLKRGL